MHSIPTHRHKMPKQYLQGWVEFYKLRFKVDERVLIPRPETELLVDEVIRFTKRNLKGMSPIILDIGTGSGNIAISLAKNLTKVKIFATDISKEALNLAKENAVLQHVSDRIIFVESDLLSALHLRGVNVNSPELIVTNLPYIPSSRIPFLTRSVKDFEPWMALDGGSDGFELYRKLFTQIKEKNLTPKLIVAEIDHTHEIVAIQEAQKYFPKAKIEVKTDLANKQRILVILTASLPK